MRLIIKLETNGKYKVYFDGSPNFYGEGTTKEEALTDLRDKIDAVLEAYVRIVQQEK